MSIIILLLMFLFPFVMWTILGDTMEIGRKSEPHPPGTRAYTRLRKLTHTHTRTHTHTHTNTRACVLRSITNLHIHSSSTVKSNEINHSQIISDLVRWDYENPKKSGTSWAINIIRAVNSIGNDNQINSERCLTRLWLYLMTILSWK